MKHNFSVARAVILAATSLAGCQTEKHQVAQGKPGQVAICTKCYDQIQIVRGNSSARTGYNPDVTIKRHSCEDCKTEMSIYNQGGVMKVMCAKCAPQGVACDLCSPMPASN